MVKEKRISRTILLILYIGLTIAINFSSIAWFKNIFKILLCFIIGKNLSDDTEEYDDFYFSILDGLFMIIAFINLGTGLIGLSNLS